MSELRMAFRECFYRSKVYTAFNRTRGVGRLYPYVKKQNIFIGQDYISSSSKIDALWLSLSSRVKALGLSLLYLYRGDIGAQQKSRNFDSPYSFFGKYIFMPHITEPRAKAIVEYLRLTPGKDRILDYGCAKGYYVKHFQDFGLEAWGVDVSEYAIKDGHEDVKGRLLRIPEEPGTSLSSRFKKKYFDAIVIKDTLEHIPEAFIPRLLDELSKIGKAALIIVPISAVDGVDFIDGINAVDETHVTRWSARTWIKLLEQYGEVSHLPRAVVERITSTKRRIHHKGTLSVKVDFR